jgi:hypothetical protein
VAKAFALRQAPGELGRGTEGTKHSRVSRDPIKFTDTAAKKRKDGVVSQQPQWKGKLSVADRMKAALNARNSVAGNVRGFTTTADEFQVVGSAFFAEMKDLGD